MMLKDGYRHVYDYKGGLEEWTHLKLPLEAAKELPQDYLERRYKMTANESSTSSLGWKLWIGQRCPNELKEGGESTGGIMSRMLALVSLFFVALGSVFS